MTTAIVLIDPYNEFLHSKGKLYPSIADSLVKTDTINNIRALLKAARRNKIPILYCLHQQTNSDSYKGWTLMNKSLTKIRDNKAFEADTWNTEIFEGMQPDTANGDVIVSKHWNSSSFQNTDLDYQLKQMGVKHVVMAGLVANTCLEATARFAYELGYKITMLADTTAGFSHEAKEAAANLIWPLFADEVLNVKEWVSELELELAGCL